MKCFQPVNELYADDRATWEPSNVNKLLWCRIAASDCVSFCGGACRVRDGDPEIV